jgi:hypothetical protein
MVTISLSQAELDALAQLLDVAVKASGIVGARAALPLIDKLEKAVAEANKPAPQETE